MAKIGSVRFGNGRVTNSWLLQGKQLSRDTYSKELVARNYDILPEDISYQDDFVWFW